MKLTALLFLVGMAFLLGLEALTRARSGDEALHWGSEDLLQTVPIADLVQEPLRSLYYLHVQPPALDAIRTIIAALDPASSLLDTARRVDRRLLLLWAAAYAGLACLIQAWLRDHVPAAVALAGGIATLLHPAALLYATIPETTLLTALLFTWSMRELCQLGSGRGSPVRLGASVVALFLVRSIFQWPAIIVYATALALLRVPRRRIAIFLAVATPFIGAYVLKQQLVFGIQTTSSFTGLNCLRSIGILPYGFDRGQPLALPIAQQSAPYARRLAALPASVLRTPTKLSGMPNCNEWQYLVYKDLLLERCRKMSAARSWRERLDGYEINWLLYLEPTSHYGNVQPILAFVPWRVVYDWPLSGPRAVCLVALAGLWWIVRRLRGPGEALRVVLLSAVGLALPLAMVIAPSILFERGENMRFRFFIEPVLLVFVTVQAVSAAQAFWGVAARAVRGDR